MAVFFLAGCNKKIEVENQDKDLSTEAQDGTSKQQSQIDELQKYKDEQQQKGEEAKQAEEVAKQAELLKQEQAENLAKEQAIKEEALRKCRDFKLNCESKINPIKMQIDEAERWIGQREDDIDSRNDLIDECKDDSCKKGYENAIAESKRLIEDKEDEIDEFESKLNKLTSGECKGYKNPC